MRRIVERMQIKTRIGQTENVEVTPGMFVTVPFTAFGPVTVAGRTFEVELEFKETSEGIKPVSIKATTADGEPISSTGLRSLAIGDLTRTAMSNAVKRGTRSQSADGAETLTLERNISAEHRAAIRAAGPVDDSLRWAAHFYEVGKLLGLPPAKQVEIELGLPRTTASKWIRRAWEKGFLSGDD